MSLPVIEFLFHLLSWETDATEGTETALAVDVQQAYTSINLEGGPGSAPLPVGLPAYQAAESAAESAVEKSGAKAGSEAAGAVKLPLLPPPGAAAAGSPAFLGWQAGAAAAAECWLPGVGPLLPTWREVAAILAPAFHPVRSFWSMASMSCLCFIVR